MTYLDGNQIDVSGSAIFWLLLRLLLNSKAILFEVCSSVADASDCAYSYVVVTTKAIPEVICTSELLKTLLSSPYCDKYAQPIYILLQNGLNVEVELYRAIETLAKGKPRIISAAVNIWSNDDGTVEHGDYVRQPSFLAIGLPI